MISYVECLGGEGAGPGVASRCWNTDPDEERDELLPRKMASLQPKTEGSLRRRLLSAKIHQKQDSIWGMNSVRRSGSHSGDKRPLPLHLQYPGNGLCYRSQNLPLRPPTHPSFAAEAHGKLQPQVPPLPQQRSTCPVLMQRRRTSSCPLTLEPRPGYTLPAPPPFSTQSCLGKPEVPTCHPYRPSRRLRHGLICVRRHRGRSSRLEATQTTPLLQRAGNGDSTWSVHYSTQKPQHGLLFIPGKGQSSSTDELQVCNRLTQHGDTSHLHQPRPASSSSSCGLNQSEANMRSGWKSRSQKMRSRLLDFLSQSCFPICFKFSVWRRKSSVSSDEDERCILTNTRPLTPLVLSPVSLTSCCDVFAPTYEPTVGVEVEPPLRLPTPEERMRQQAEAVGADIVPINVTGESFDRQASFQRPLSRVDSLARRPRNLGYRKTVTGTPDISQKPDLPLILPGQDLTAGPPAVSSSTSTHWQNNTEEEVEERCRAEITKEGQSSARRVCDPKGDGISSLMVSVTSSQCVDSCQDRAASCCTSSSEVHTPPHLATNWSLKSEASCNCASYWGTLIASSSCHQSQDLQGFPSDLHPLLPFDPTARVIPQSPFPSPSSFSSSSVTSSLPSTPSHILQSECSYSSDKPLIEFAQHNRFTITDSESQFTHQALDDQTATQHDTQCSNDGGSYNWERCSYQPLSAISSGQTRTKWNSITEETRCLSSEGCSCDHLLSSGHSLPTCTDSNSMCSEKITTSHLLKREKTNSSPSTCCRTVTRSISLCKSKRPPPPPLRSVSLSCRPNYSKPSCSSSRSRLEYNPCLELTTQRTPTSCPQTFQDPWVPRKNTKTPQSGLTCGRVTTFEPLSPDCLVATAKDSSPPEYLHLNPGHFHAHVFPPGSLGSETEGLSFGLSPQPTAPSMAGLPCLASPSSGYSSQSNTPTPGTPLSSPITPCSPLTASPGVFSLPLTSQLSSSSHSNSLPLSPSISSLPRTRSWKRKGKEERRPKPPVPERKSSLFSSTSSLSCTSSGYPLLPSPPSPPPLPKCSFPTFYYSCICESAPPESPSTTKLSVAPPCQPSSISLPPPSLPPHLPFSLPLPFLLSPSSRPSPPPYSYAIRQACHHTLEDAKSSVSFPPSTSLPPPPSTLLPPVSGLSDLPPAERPTPPPPPLPTLPTLSASPFSSSFSKSQNNCLKMAKSPCPLVTAQALQGIKLRTVKNQEGRLTSIVPTDSPSVDLSSQAGMLSAYTSPANTCHDLPSKEVHPDCAVANAALDDLCNTEVKLIDPGSQNAVCTLGGNENNISSAIMDNASFHNLANTDAKQPRFKSNHEYCNLTKSEMRTSNEGLQDSVPGPANQGNSWSQVTSVETPQDIQSNEQDREDMQSNNQLASPDEPWLKVSYNNSKNHNTNFQQSPLQQQVKDAMLTAPAEKQENTAAIWHMDSSCSALSRKNQTCYRESRILVESRDEVEINDNNSDVQNHSAAGRDFTTYCDVKQNDEVFQPDSPRKHLFPEKPKHSHCFLGFTAPLETRSVQIAAASPGIHFHLPLPPGCSCTHLTPAQKYLTCTAEKTQITCDITTLPTHSVDAASPLVNTRPADITIQTLATSPQMQKLPILHNEPDLSLISPSTAQQFVAQNTGEALKSTSGICGTLENTGILQTQSTSWVVSTVGSRNTLTRMMGAMERRTSGPTHIEMGTCTSSVILSNMEPWSSKGAPNNINGTNLEDNLENCDTWGTSGTYNILSKSGVHRAASTRTGDNQTQAEIMRTRQDDEKTFPKTKKRSLLAGHKEQQEKHRLEDRGKKTMMKMSSFSTNHKDKGRKRRVGRELLMKSPTVQPSLSSSSCSEEDEQDEVKGQTMQTSERVRMTKVCDSEISDSESSCSLNSQSGYSLSSALSTDSSQEDLSLPDLQIQEPGEEIFKERSKEEAQRSGMDVRETRESPDADLFVSISADQMFVSSQPRTTEDLFAVIHRLKRKMLGRKESEEDRHCIPTSSSSPLLSPIGHLLHPTQPAARRSQKSARSDSFKALLLKKGSRSESSSRISAVERLCQVVAPATVADLQKAPSLPPPPDQTQGKPTRLSNSLDTLDVNAHMTLDMPLSPMSLWGQNSVMLGLRLKDPNHLLFTSSSPPVFFLSPSSMHPRSLAPPCSYRRHFAARCRLFAAPMAAIFEGEHEEEEDSVFVASPGSKGEMSQRLLEIP